MSLADRLHRAQEADVTYATANPRPRHLVVGRGPEAFDAAVAAVRDWAPQRSIGARIYPADAAVELGATILVILRAGPFRIIAPNRIVSVTDEPRQFAYAYGTLPGHPECGEERFAITHHDDGRVIATVAVDARPATLPARLAGPVAVWLQAAALRRYLHAIRKAARCN